MDEMQTAEELARLSWLETATVRAYDSVEHKVTDEDLRQRLGAFRNDHARHLSRMHRLLEKTAGGPEPSTEFIAFVREELNVVERTQDARHALEHLLLLERANAMFFADALAAELPGEAEALVSEEYEDSGRHVDEVELHAPHAVVGAGTSGLSAGIGGGTGVTPEGGIIPGAVPSRLPQSPTERQMESDIRGDVPPGFPGGGGGGKGDR
jgi:rubrerythrin